MNKHLTIENKSVTHGDAIMQGIKQRFNEINQNFPIKLKRMNRRMIKYGDVITNILNLTHDRRERIHNHEPAIFY